MVEDSNDAVPGDGREETRAQRADRLWDDMLQELRVMQTGAQLTAGFLLTLPFQQAFGELSDGQRTFYLGLVLLATVVTALVLTPVAIHRRLAGRQVKDRLVASARVALRAVLAALALLILGTATFVFDVVVSRTAALAAGACLAVVLVSLLIVVPHRLVDR